MEPRSSSDPGNYSAISPSTRDPLIVESEERFRALVTATADVVYRMSADWKEMRELKGRGFLSDTGAPIADWLNKYIPPIDQRRMLEIIRQAIDTKTIFAMEHQVLRSDATPGWTFSRAVPVFNDKNKIIEWFGTASDVTSRKQMEEELRIAKEASEGSKRLYETITNNTPDLIYVFDLQYRFTYANEALLRMWGKSWEQAIGKKLVENGYEPWHAEMHEREIDQVAATRQPLRGEVSFPHAVLGKRIYDYIFVPVLDEKGEVEAVAGTTRDITDIRRAEETLQRSREQLEATVEERTRALHRSNEDLQQFAHVASHDLKEPIRKIMLFASRLSNECSGQMDDKGLRFLHTIQRSATRMYAMIEGILSYSSLEAMELAPEPVDLNSIMHEIENDLEVAIQQKQATIQYTQLPVIKGSHLLLFQLFSNLVGNALKFSKAESRPHINITAKPLSGAELQTAGLNDDKSYISLTFRDNGIGFSQQYAETIFQTFSRLNTKDRFEGTGLGLALCRKIVERHGGIIRASGEENEGAAFTIFLPLEETGKYSEHN